MRLRPFFLSLSGVGMMSRAKSDYALWLFIGVVVVILLYLLRRRKAEEERRDYGGVREVGRLRVSSSGWYPYCFRVLEV